MRSPVSPPRATMQSAGRGVPAGAARNEAACQTAAPSASAAALAAASVFPNLKPGARPRSAPSPARPSSLLLNDIRGIWSRRVLNGNIDVVEDIATGYQTPDTAIDLQPDRRILHSIALDDHILNPWSFGIQSHHFDMRVPAQLVMAKHAAQREGCSVGRSLKTIGTHNCFTGECRVVRSTSVNVAVDDFVIEELIEPGRLIVLIPAARVVERPGA